jgi:hypothetical protein
MRSIPSFVTCIALLLLSDGLEGQVFQSPHLQLQQSKVNGRHARVVLALGPFHLRSFDAEHRHRPAVGPVELETVKLSSPDQRKGPEEEVIGSKH